jgi:1-acyl-sn-glycerol-3-phosphate acyltransferase
MRLLTIPFGLLFGAYALIVSCIAAGFTGFTGVLPFAVLPRGQRETRIMYPASWWATFVVRFVLLARPTITGGYEPGPTGALFISNHRSWLDPLLMMAYVRSQGLSKSTIKFIPFVGWFARMAGTVFVDRDSLWSRKRAKDEVMFLVRSGARLTLYPEGTRTRDGDMLRKVHLALVKDCFHEGLPVVPCAVWGTERTLPVGPPLAWPLQRCRLDIGTPLVPSDFPDADAFAKACWAEVTARAERLRRENEVTPSSIERAA